MTCFTIETGVACIWLAGEAVVVIQVLAKIGKDDDNNNV